MPAGHERDPLLAVLNGDPVAPGADDEARTAHRAAEADVELIRGALRDIGDALAAAPGASAAAAASPAPPDALAARRRARRRSAVVWGAGLAAAAAFTGVMYLGAVGGLAGDAGHSAADAKAAAPAAGGDEKAAGPGAYADRPALACASLAVEGTVVDLRPLSDGHVRVTLEAERYWVPEQEAAEAPVAVTVLPQEARTDLPVGARALVVRGPSGGWWAAGDRLAAERAELDAARRGADEGTCPRG